MICPSPALAILILSDTKRRLVFSRKINPCPFLAATAIRTKSETNLFEQSILIPAPAIANHIISDVTIIYLF